MTKVTVRTQDGKTVEATLGKLEKAAQRVRKGVVIPPPLPGMDQTDGHVPAQVRDIAETYARLSADAIQMKDQADQEKKKLLNKMIELKIPFVIVVIGKWKERIELKQGKHDLVIKQIGIVDDSNGDEGHIEESEEKD